MKQCLKCKKEFKIYVTIDGKERNIHKRSYCLECSPFGKRNTKRLHLAPRDRNSTKQCTDCGRKFKWTKNNVCSTCRTFKRRNEQRIRAIEYCGGKCKNCGHEDTDVLTFHHKNPKTKKFALCNHWHKAWSTILKEIKKCELLCANCHIKLHRKEIK